MFRPVQHPNSRVFRVRVACLGLGLRVWGLG